MNVTRTPESAFADLPDYPFEANYVDLDGVRMHYVDEGERSAAPVLMLHGEPTWSYLYRHMIPPCAAAGHRVIAPDLIGFGKSDKPSSKSDYSYERHVRWVTGFVEALDLRGITLFCQDWGALIGLRVAAENDERFERIVIGNGALPTADGRTRPSAIGVPAFLTWRTFATLSPAFPIGRIVNTGCRRRLSADERRAYDAPFTPPGSIAGARAFPKLVPLTPRDPAIKANRAAWDALEHWEKPFLTVFSDGDPITRGAERSFQRRVPGAAAQEHRRPHAGHFLQEDVPEELARAINELIARSATAPGAASPSPAS
jgi:haloalkane dehalogenase